MKALASKIGVNIGAYPVLAAETEQKAAEVGVAMCRSGKAQAMMKGSLHTDELMKAAMHRDTGLRTARRISHVFIMDTPAYERTLAHYRRGHQHHSRARRQDPHRAERD